MKTIKIGYSGKEVSELCNLLGVSKRDEFDSDLTNKVKDFQKSNNLVSDGIVGPNTWTRLFLNYRDTKYTTGSIQEYDYTWAGELLNCEPEAIMAVVKVETGNDGGFIADGKPTILFEGHIFWKELKNVGIDPQKYSKSHPNIVYSKWDKSKYKGGIKEYDRLNEAIKINREAALKSISMGMFQLMGFNYSLCGCSSVDEMWSRSCKSEVEQFALGLQFIMSSNLSIYLREKDWKEFAKKYNGPEYYKNQYDKKLEIAYKSYK